MFEGCFYKGHSNDQKLNELVLMLQLVDMGTGCILHVMHMEGTRMKRPGIDGLSRGDILERIMTGKKMLDFIPLNESADGRSGGREIIWINSWWKDRK